MAAIIIELRAIGSFNAITTDNMAANKNYIEIECVTPIKNKSKQ